MIVDEIIGHASDNKPCLRKAIWGVIYPDLVTEVDQLIERK